MTSYGIFIITILYLQNNTSVTYKNYITYITGYLLYLQYNIILYFFYTLRTKLHYYITQKSTYMHLHIYIPICTCTYLYIFNNYWMRLSRIWRILQIKEGVIHRGRRPRCITPSEICRILHILRKPNSIIALLFIQNISSFLKEFRNYAFCFSAHQI